MKNLSLLSFIILLVFAAGSACTNPLTKAAKQYTCVVNGETEPRSAEDFIARGRFHFERKENQCFFEACSEAVRLEPNNAKAYSCRGSGYLFHQKDYDKAIEDQTRAIELDPNNRTFFARRAAAYEEKKLFDPALADLDKSLKLSETDVQKSSIFESMANVLYAKNDPDAALARADEAIKLNPTDNWNFATRAKIYRKLGKNDLAEADERKAKELEAAKTK